MSTKVTIERQEQEDGAPGWHLYEELLDAEDFVYLELDGVQLDVGVGRGGSLAGSPVDTVLLRLPTATAVRLGLLPRGWPRRATGKVTT
ncbi:hypothetical protein [Paraburkholderia youngii]|uniref:hypothetical protein n=1 Tax=Paraburkholderia youngii TaxID=2782701 RepID=UPI003D211FA8